ncbi:hypothetical protein KM043_002685 [Ampulex compressa]|nr:hypothetical protein KM043_002685 [Ampulex compressa]
MQPGPSYHSTPCRKSKEDTSNPRWRFEAVLSTRYEEREASGQNTLRLHLALLVVGVEGGGGSLGQVVSLRSASTSLQVVARILRPAERLVIRRERGSAMRTWLIDPAIPCRRTRLDPRPGRLPAGKSSPWSSALGRKTSFNCHKAGLAMKRGGCGSRKGGWAGLEGGQKVGSRPAGDGEPRGRSARWEDRKGDPRDAGRIDPGGRRSIFRRCTAIAGSIMRENLHGVEYSEFLAIKIERRKSSNAPGSLPHRIDRLEGSINMMQKLGKKRVVLHFDDAKLSLEVLCARICMELNIPNSWR